MNALESLKRQVQNATEDVTHLAVSRDAEHKLLNNQKQVLALLGDVQQELRHLRRDVSRRSGGGFPWGLVIVAGAAYALYRSTPAVRDRVHDLLGTIDPGLQGNLKRAADAAKDAVHDVAQGDSPTDAVRRAAGEVKRAGEKAADGAGEAWQDAKDSARQAADDMKNSTSRGIA